LEKKLTYDKTDDNNKDIFLPNKLSSDKTCIKKEGGLMEKKAKKQGVDESREKINQFIIECMFSKYFAEEKDNKVVAKREKVAV